MRHHPQARGYATFNDAVRAQRERTESNSRKPAHGGYPGQTHPAILGNPHFTTDAVLGRSRATCPDCRVDLTCPYHRTH